MLVDVRISQTSRCGIDALEAKTPMASDARSRVGMEKSLNMVIWILVREILPCGFYTFAKSLDVSN
jgi:hypothetical protein